MSIYRGRTNTEFYLASVLYDSIEDQNISAVTKLITEKGADANIILPRKGISPLHLAIGSENAEFAYNISALILQHGGNPNIRSDEGLTPLHIASAWGRKELVNLFLNCGADPDMQDYSYQTAENYALEEGHTEIAEIIRNYINQDAFSVFSTKGDNKNIFDLTLDKILINNGQAIGEYEVAKGEHELQSIDLKVLPQTSPNEYVMNWCNTLETNLENLNNLSNEEDAIKLSSPEETNDFEHVTITRPKVKEASSSPESGIYFNPPSVKTHCNISEKDRESGFNTLPDLTNEENNLEDYVESGPSRKISVAKSKDTSSDYFTCTEVSENILEQNIFEISSTISSNKSLDLNQAQGLNNCENDLSFVSVSEVYKYSDHEEGIVLYEKRILPMQTSTSNETDVYTVSSITSKLSSLPRNFDYDTDSLRKELIKAGYEPGPITQTTKRVYLRKLYNLKKNPLDMNIVETNVKKTYSCEIQKTLHYPEWTSDLTMYQELETLVTKQFNNPDPNRRWREGVNKTSFTYLLLDPRITQNLPCRAEVLSQPEQWEIFLNSIFYVGKGKRSRPYQHLYDAVSLYNKQIYKSQSTKLQRILDIWSENQGVICLHIFQNVIPVEAYTREAAMISALKLENVENIKGGEFYGIAATWSSQQKRNLGVYLLYKAMRIFLNEGERQLSPSDID